MTNNYQEIFKKCSRCGGCQAHCPLYAETGREPYVARGKIELMENLEANNLEWNDKLAQIFSTCLLCGSCSENCPNGVEADKLVRLARKDLVLARGLPIIKKNVFQHLLKYNGRLKTVGKLLAFYQKSGLQKIVRGTGILNLMPMDLARKESILPSISGRAFRDTVSARNTVENPKLKVAYFTGCITNLVNPQVGISVLEVLGTHNVEVIIPEQYCCGVPALASGETEVTKFLATENIKYFTNLDVDYIIMDCATCLSTWLEYPELLESEEAGKLTGKVIDINRFLVEILDIKLKPRELGIMVTYHDPCHLKRTPGGKTSPREVLKGLSPSYEFVEMELADRCCGSAGSFNLTHYELSQKVAHHKVEAIKASKAQIVTSSCPSCIMQLNHSLKNNNIDVEVKHTIELVADCLKANSLS
ncbi:MAG: glycolate oxidase iron-sulfur subunit [Clostridia bacterium]|nr:glycolate oxidase iron-sulfur subunit [Clostridia bacterium]